MIDTIIKRDGTEVPFDISRIAIAIKKANDKIAKDKPNEIITNQNILHLAESVSHKMEESGATNVEDIQDLVEATLVEAGCSSTAKEYILFRSNRNRIRNMSSSLMETFKRLTFTASKDDDLKRENANIDGDTSMGTMLRYGSEGAKHFVDTFVLPEHIANAHSSGDIHIHDKDFYMLTLTCCQIDLLKLFKDGFSTGHGYLREPNSIESYSALACIVIQANQNEMHGGQSIPNLDFAMAPGITKTFIKEYKKYFHIYTELNNITNLSIENLNTAHFTTEDGILISIGSDANVKTVVKRTIEYSNTDYDLTILDKAHIYAYTKAIDAVDKRCYQAMESLVHNLNTLNSRSGAQVPFSSINYGTDTSFEGRMVMRNLLEATKAGLGMGETAIFPVQIFKVKEGVNYNPEDPNYDLFKLAMETSALRLFPNFSFLDAPFNKQFYDQGEDVSYMGCRTRVIGNTYSPDKEVTAGRGNISFTSINLPRIAIEHREVDQFFKALEEKIELVCEQMLHRLEIQGKKTVRNFPFLMGQGIWIDSDKLGLDDPIIDIIKNGTLSLGFIGLAETLILLTGKHHGESEESQRLGLEIVKYLRDRLDVKSQSMKLNFTLIATPAEGLSGRFIELDKKKYGTIEGVTDKDYYTNSYHVPVYHDIKIHKKIDLEAPYHQYCNAGHISYVELDGDTSKNPEAFESIVRYMKESGMGYGSINHPLDRDPVCGYIGVIKDVCPRCGRRAGEPVDVEKLRSLGIDIPIQQ